MPGASSPPLPGQVRMSSTGAASRIITVAAPISQGSGRAETRRAQDSERLGSERIGER